jgi:hypothetical protein
VFWIIVAIAAFIFGPIEAVYGVGLAAVFSLGLAMLNYNEAWEGTVERIETRRVRVRYGNTNRYHNEDQLHAIARLTNGKKKDLRCLADWSAGDRLVKRRGEAMIRIPVRQV